MTMVRPRAANRLERRRPELSIAYTAAEVFFPLFIVFGFGAVQTTSVQPQLAVAALGLGATILAPKEALRRLPVSGVWILWVVWTAATYFWTVYPYATAAFLRFELSGAVAAVGCAAILPLPRLKRALCNGFYLVTAISLFAIVTSAASRMQVDPILGATPVNGWRGYFTHKNELAPFMVIALATVWCFETRRAVRRWFIVTTLVIMVFAKSATGLSALFVVAGAYVWAKRYRRQSQREKFSFVVVSAIALLTFIFLTYSLFGLVVNLYGKDVTLSGRVYVWRAVKWAINKRPLIGYGRNAVFLHGDREPLVSITDRVGFEPSHPHEGFLYAWIETGFVGLVLFCLAWMSAFRAVWRRLHDRVDVSTWGLMFLLAQLVICLSEVPIFYGWTAFVGIVGVVNSRAYSDEDPEAYGTWEGAVAASRGRSRVIGVSRA